VGETRAPRVVIVGAGMSGICMGIKLKQAGIDTFTIYEKAGEVGGTWRDNTYPGLACDVPSRYYSYSFEPNPDWSRYYSPGYEIQDYFRQAADRHGVRSHIRFETEVERASFEDGRWRIATSAGETEEADFVVSAAGVLRELRYPDIPGLDSFGGAAFHSARWDHDVELRGRRVGVIGNGSTGVQLMCSLPEIASHVTSFQRTPQWIFPMPNPRYSKLTRRLMRRVPALNRLAYRGWQRYFEFVGRGMVEPGFMRNLGVLICNLNLRTVRDPDLRRKLTPDYLPACKRLVFSGRFYKAMQRPDVALVTDRIERVEPRGVVTADGVLHELDVLVLATGYDAHTYMRPMELIAPGGVTLEETWRDGPHAYRSVALPGFPNFFMLQGPHSPFGNQSIVTVAESQTDYVLRFVRMFAEGRFDAAEPTAEATARYNEELRAALPNTVWTTGCKSWFLGKNGLPELWPWRPERHREMLSEVALDEFELTTAGDREPVAAAS
jgi:cation diffusion facilitator CzcD-associated flavoprotein CzcO